MIKFQPIYTKEGKISHIETALAGDDLLACARLNKGTAFTLAERAQFGLDGCLPHQVETLDEQAVRMIAQYREHPTNLGKYNHLNVLHDYNETLFYKVAHEHLEEILPIIYTPTVGEAVQKFSREYRQASGLYISYPDRHRIAELLEHRLPKEVDLTVVTDGESVLGIGDQGIGGMSISAAKLMVYTLCGGINPHRVLPILLDVGTNNEALLNDPMYLGWRHKRISGSDYHEFIALFVEAITKKFPQMLLHWEDLGRDNARYILNHYRHKICTFNDDMQGTAVVAVASLMAGMKAMGMPDWRDHRIVILGAGNAGMGIADHVASMMQESGLSEKEARNGLWLLDRRGLIVKNGSDAPRNHYARNQADVAHWTLKNENSIFLYDVVKNLKPTVLIGCSTVSSAFTEEIVRLMASSVSRPIIMPLSNPTVLAEAVPEDLWHWTDGKALIATGSPFPPVKAGNISYRIAQCNNAFAFPGIGLGVIISKAAHVTDSMLFAATKALSECSPILKENNAPLLPQISESRLVGRKIALAVANEARRAGVACVSQQADFNALLEAAIWEPAYYTYKKK